MTIMRVDAYKILRVNGGYDPDYYMSEACMYLALAYHDLYGYQLAMVYDEKDDTIAHVFVVDESGMGLDATGKRSIDSIVKSYYDLARPSVAYISKDELLGLMGDDKPLFGYDESEIEEAKKFIQDNLRPTVQVPQLPKRDR